MSGQIKNKNYDWSIALIKFIATFFVLNSHMGICYPEKYKMLATGGAIGNALFFFISGFTLFLSKPLPFIEYYKKRISRIYPAVIAVAIIACLFFNAQGNFIMQLGAYWFVNCIMIYYAILWVCRRYGLNMPIVIAISGVLTCLIIFFNYDFASQGIFYGDSVLRYFIYFAFMAQGAYLGVNRENYKYNFWHLILMVVSFIAWYGISFYYAKSPLSLVSLLALFLFTYSLYVVGKSRLIEKIIRSRFIAGFVGFCGNLCLEVYLIQKYLFTDALNNLFPLNIPIVMFIVIMGAYLLHILSNLILQTFNSNPYNFKKMVSV